MNEETKAPPSSPQAAFPGESESNRFEVVFQNALDAIVGMSSEGMITDWNPQAELIFGWSKKEAVGQRMSEMIIPHRHRQQHEQGLKHFRETGRGPILNQRIEIAASRKSGEEFPVELTVTPVSTKDGVAFYAYVRDLSEQKETRALLETLLQTAPVGLGFVGRDLKYIRVNHALAAFNGVSAEAHVGRRLSEIVPQIAPQVEPLYQKVLDEGAPIINLEISGETPSAPGKIRHWLVSYYPVRIAEGSVLGVGIVVSEITDRKEAEAKLGLSEARYRALIEQSPLAIQVFSPDGHCIQVNQAWSKLWSTSSAQLEGYNILEDSGLESNGLVSFVKKALLGESTVTHPIKYERGHVGNAERSLWVQAYVYPVRGIYGKVREVALLLEDISERKWAEDELSQAVINEREARLEAERTKNQLRFLGEATKTLLADPLSYSSRLEKLTQIIVPEFSEWCVVDILEEDGTLKTYAVAHSDQDKVSLARSLRERYPVDMSADYGVPQVIRTGRTEFMREIGSDLILKASRDAEHREILESLNLKSYICTPMQCRGRTVGAVTFVSSTKSFTEYDVAMAEELSHRAALALDNAKLFDDTQQAVQIRDEFLSIASHELKTPMTPLKLQLQILQRVISKGALLSYPPEKLAKMIHMADSQLSRLATLIDDLLDVSRIRAGKLKLNYEEFDFSEMIREVLERYQSQIQASKYEIHLDVQSGCTGSFDRLRVEQMFINLLTNALKYGNQKPIAIRTKADSCSVTLEIEDKGIGLSLEDQSRIFDRFERVMSSANIGGLGLGLYITRQIVEAHSGRITVQSASGEGARFEVLLPRISPKSSDSVDG